METKKLGDFCKLRQGFQVPLPDQETELKDGYVRFIRIVDYTQETDDIRYVKNSEKFYYVEPDDVVMVRYGAAGEVGHGISGVIANNMFLIEPLIKINKDYLYYYLAQNKIRHKLLSSSTSTTMPALNFKIVNDLDVPLYEKDKQDEIVAILNKLSSVIEKRKNEIIALDELIKARFVELFGNPVRNSMEWETYQLDECLERIDNGKSFVCSDKPREDNYPAVLKLSAATYGDYRPSENKALLDEKQFVESAEVHVGDLLFTRKNTPELVGMAAYVQETPSKLMMPDLIFRLVPNEKMNAVFLWQLINCKEFRPVIQAISGGSAKSMSNISKERLGKIKVICPPRELQDSLVPFIKQVDKSKSAIQKSLDETQLLFDSLMQKYFG